MKKRFFTRELKFGIIVIGALFLLYFGLNFLKGINIFSSTYSYYAKYDNIGGLVASTPVNIKGYKVGQVDEIAYDFTKKEAFTVKISVSKNIKLPLETVVELYDDGIMGGKAIQLLLPENSSSGTFYAEGDIIQSQVSLGLIDQLTSSLLPKIESISLQADSLIVSLRELVENENLTNSLSSIEKTTGDLAISSAQLKKMMMNELPSLINKTDILISNFSDVGYKLKQIDYNGTFSALDYTISSLNTITDKVNSNNGTLGALLNDRQLYIDLLSLSSNADSLLIDLKQNPKRYVHFSIFGRK